MYCFPSTATLFTTLSHLKSTNVHQFQALLGQNGSQCFNILIFWGFFLKYLSVSEIKSFAPFTHPFSIFEFENPIKPPSVSFFLILNYSLLNICLFDFLFSPRRINEATSAASSKQRRLSLRLYLRVSVC